METDWEKPIEANYNGEWRPARVLDTLIGGRQAVAVKREVTETLWECRTDDCHIRNVKTKREGWVGVWSNGGTKHVRSRIYDSFDEATADCPNATAICRIEWEE